jgi:hypothetical protein
LSKLEHLYKFVGLISFFLLLLFSAVSSWWVGFLPCLKACKLVSAGVWFCFWF